MIGASGGKLNQIRRLKISKNEEHTVTFVTLLKCCPFHSYLDRAIGMNAKSNEKS